MNLRYTLLSVILLLLAFGFTILPEKNYSKDLSAEEVLLAVLDDSRYISTDEIASLLLNNDPSLQLIDVRKPEQFKEFSLPGAINIPIDSLLTEEADLYLDQDVKLNVLYSNGSIYASQAWLLYKRMGYQKVFIMRGGLNYWIETIIRPSEPKINEPASAFATYQFRKGASQYFGGGTVDATSSTSTTKKKPIIRRKKKSVAGGC
ncbi:MAG: rhodanese-like domain-containing protein [Bacteroidales bacterium]|nr:rhodanese-like domain-containing protein [Bacteroidales bacterium]